MRDILYDNSFERAFVTIPMNDSIVSSYFGCELIKILIF